MEGRSKDLTTKIQRLERNWSKMVQNVKPIEEDKQCIYRIPPRILENNPKVYTPQIVSIGPYHHKVDNIF